MMNKDRKDFYDITWFNRLYITWMMSLLKETGDMELVERVDKIVVSKMGAKMGDKVLEIRPDFINGNLDILLEAFEYTHWYQETVSLLSKNDDEMILGVDNCSYQCFWKKWNDSNYSQCIQPHLGFMREFVKKINPSFEVDNLETPEKCGKCKWRIYRNY